MFGMGGMPNFGNIRQGLMGSSPIAQPMDDVSGGGMNVMSSLKNHSNFGTQFASNPMGNPMSGGFGRTSGFMGF